MMTQTHALVATALFARPSRPARQNIAILIGSFIPDAAIYTLFFWSKLAGISEEKLWNEIYFSEPMLSFTAIGNSFPLYFAILMIGIFWAQRNLSRDLVIADKGSLNASSDYRALVYGSGICLFALAAMTHLAGDLPVHVNDAHPHFWPLTDWRFRSPVSYWNRDHHGGVFSLMEAILGVVLSIVIFRRFKALAVRFFAMLALTAYIALPAYFFFILG